MQKNNQQRSSDTSIKKILYIALAIIFIIGIYLYKNKTKITNNYQNQTEKLQQIKKPAASPSKLFYTRDKEYRTIDEIKDLFLKLNVEYANKPRYAKECEIFRKMKKTDFEDFNTNPEFYENLFKIYNDVVTNEYVAPIYIKWVKDNIGYGVFASEDIPGGTLIAEYIGDVIPKNQIEDKTWSWKYPSKNSFKPKFPTSISLNGFRYANETRFINHSDNPNCKTQFMYANGTWRLLYVATRYIKKDQEILVSYGKKYWNKRTKIKLGE